jgi:hypothetical protein
MSSNGCLPVTGTTVARNGLWSRASWSSCRLYRSQPVLERGEGSRGLLGVFFVSVLRSGNSFAEYDLIRLILSASVLEEA